MRSFLPRPYGTAARFYDWLSLERVLYRPGRTAAVELLALAPGERVLDVGCGTGLSFPLLVAAVGSEGRVVGVDASADMLTQAMRRVTEHGWTNVTVIRGDAAQLPDLVDGPFDAVLFAYSLAVIDDWVAAWSQARALLRPGGRAGVVDTDLPAGRWRALAPLALVAQLAGGVDRRRHVWALATSDTTDAQHRTLRGGHVQVAAGTTPAPPDGFTQ